MGTKLAANPVSGRSRAPRGVPTGGQFAAEAKDEPTPLLGTDHDAEHGSTIEPSAVRDPRSVDDLLDLQNDRLAEVRQADAEGTVIDPGGLPPEDGNQLVKDSLLPHRAFNQVRRNYARQFIADMQSQDLTRRPEVVAELDDERARLEDLESRSHLVFLNDICRADSGMDEFQLSDAHDGNRLPEKHARWADIAVLTSAPADPDEKTDHVLVSLSALDGNGHGSTFAERARIVVPCNMVCSYGSKDSPVWTPYLADYLEGESHMDNGHGHSARSALDLVFNAHRP